MDSLLLESSIGLNTAVQNFGMYQYQSSISGPNIEYQILIYLIILFYLFLLLFF